MLEHLTPWSPTTAVTSRIKIDDLRITFKRTVRVPDTNKVNDLPPDMGSFPLYKVDDYADKLPVNMAQKGGLFIPMYQREAIWINFESSRCYAIKIHVGGINAISGEPAVPNAATTLRRRNRINQGKHIQDYIVVPRQHWLDDVATKPEKVRQFVALPVGTGHSIEAQMTGEETTAGVQFEITRLSFKELAIDDENRITVDIRLLSGKQIFLAVLRSATVHELKCRCGLETGKTADKIRFVFEGKQLEDIKTLGYYNICHQSILYVLERLRGGGGGPPPPGPEMNVTAGGLIRQGTVKFERDGYDCQKSVPITFNVQILNSASFEQVTGESPPKSPVTAHTYARFGYPFFSIYEEPTTISADFQSLRSIAQIEERVEQPMPSRMPVVDVATIGAIGLLNANGSSQEIELEWELVDRLGEMRSIF